MAAAVREITLVLAPARKGPPGADGRGGRDGRSGASGAGGLAGATRKLFHDPGPAGNNRVLVAFEGWRLRRVCTRHVRGGPWRSSSSAGGVDRALLRGRPRRLHRRRQHLPRRAGRHRLAPQGRRPGAPRGRRPVRRDAGEPAHAGPRPAGGLPGPRRDAARAGGAAGAARAARVPGGAGRPARHGRNDARGPRDAVGALGGESDAVPDVLEFLREDLGRMGESRA
jgi:hypothetical protein